MNAFVQMGHFLSSNSGYLLNLTGGQVVLCVVALVVAIVIALPVGMVVGHLHRFSFLAINGGNVLRALPTLAVVAIGLAIYGIGFTNILVALVILAIPLIITNAYVAIAGVDPGMVEAARGMGMTGWEILVRVELPNAVPLIMAGIRTSSVYVVASAYLAGFAGYTGTLGDIITNGTYPLGAVMAATLIVIILAFLGEVLLASLERLLSPRGLRLTPVTATV